MSTFDTLRDANETLSKSLFVISLYSIVLRDLLDTQRKSQQASHRSEFEASAMIEEPLLSAHRRIILFNLI